MGRQTKTIQVTTSVSRHNSEQDRIDDEALERLRKKIEEAVTNVQAEYPDAWYYEPMVDGPW